MKIKLKPQFAIFFIFIAFASPCFSQNDSPLQFGADLMSRYIWRGVNLGGESPSIQPWLKYTCSTKDTSHSFSLGAWGAYNFNTANNEVDLYFAYTYKSFLSFTFTDYFFPGMFSNSSSRSDFFNYNKDSTCHVLEPAISFNGTQKIPFTLLFAMNVYGADARHIKENGTPGNLFYSKYIEAGYKHTIKGVDLNAFVGLTLDNPDEAKGEYGYYGQNTSAGIINIGLKASGKINITEKYGLPIQSLLILNPESQKIYLVFGISF